MLAEQFIFIIEVMQIPFPITLAKLSVLAFFQRVFPLPSVRIANMAIATVVIAHAIVVFLVAWFQCQPISKAWDHLVPGTCIDQLAWARYISVPNIITDAAMLVLPLPIIWNIQKSLAQRVGLMIIFVLGSLYVSFLGVIGYSV